jgi:hypothetical protein
MTIQRMEHVGVVVDDRLASVSGRRGARSMIGTDEPV